MSDAAPACAAPVVRGKYELDFIPVVNFRLGMRFQMAGDGRFSGFSDTMAYTLDTRRCDGALTPDEHDEVTRAVNEASLFCQTSWPEEGFDRSLYDVRIRTTDGARQNRFCGYGDDTHPEVTAILAVPHPLLRALEAAGACTGPMYEVADRCPAM